MSAKGRKQRGGSETDSAPATNAKHGAHGSVGDYLNSGRDNILQAVLLADTFSVRFRPLTLETAKVLLPVCNIPMIEYALESLISANVTEIIIFAHSHSTAIQSFISQTSSHNKWKRFLDNKLIKFVISDQTSSTGDALRHIYTLDIIKHDFILMSADTISAVNIGAVVAAHKKRISSGADKSAIMTCILTRTAPSHHTRTCDDDTIICLDSSSQQILYYDNEITNTNTSIPFSHITDTTRNNNTSHTSVSFHSDLLDTGIDICTPTVLLLFTDNFDYQHIRSDFVRGVIDESDVSGHSIYAYITEEYSTRVTDLYTYATCNMDILQRWSYPIVPDINVFQNTTYTCSRQYTYLENDVILARECLISRNVMIGSKTRIGSRTNIKQSVIGRQCSIGANVQIIGSYIWSNVIIQDNVTIEYAIVADNVTIMAGARIERGSIISYGVTIGRGHHVPARTMITAIPPHIDADVGKDGGRGRIWRPNEEDDDVEDDDDGESETVHRFDHVNSVVPDYDEVRRARRHQYTTALEEEEERDRSLALDEASAESFISQSAGTTQSLINDNRLADADRTDRFLIEARETLKRGVDENLPVDAIVLEMASLKMSHNANMEEYATAAFIAFFSAIKTPADQASSSSSVTMTQSSSSTSLTNTSNSSPSETQLRKSLMINPSTLIKKQLNDLLIHWSPILKKFAKGLSAQKAFIYGLERACLYENEIYIGLFAITLQLLNQRAEVIDEDAIEEWERERLSDMSATNKQRFLVLAKEFLTWLKEAEEDEDDDEDGDDDDDGDDEDGE